MFLKKKKKWYSDQLGVVSIEAGKRGWSVGYLLMSVLQECFSSAHLLPSAIGLGGAALCAP